MTPSPEIEAAAAYVMALADAVKSGAGLAVTPAEAAFARQRLRPVAADLLAGLHRPEIEQQEAVDG